MTSPRPYTTWKRRWSVAPAVKINPPGIGRAVSASLSNRMITWLMAAGMEITRRTRDNSAAWTTDGASNSVAVPDTNR